MEKIFDILNQARGMKIKTVVLSGGEPFLVPKLILRCLEIINDDVKLKNQIFIWTETNLEPFIGENGKAFMDQDENK